VPKWFAVAPERGQEPPETEVPGSSPGPPNLASHQNHLGLDLRNSALSDSMRAVFAMGSTRR